MYTIIKYYTSIVIDIEGLDLSQFNITKRQKIKAYLYKQDNKCSKRKALEYAGIKIYNASNQWNSVERDKDVYIFCDKLNKHHNSIPINNNKLSRQSIIEELKSFEGRDKLKALELIGKLKGYFDDKQGELDRSKPIYIVTGSRRTPTQRKTVEDRQDTAVQEHSNEAI